MSEVAVGDIKALYDAELDWDYYPKLRDAALASDGNASELEKLAQDTDASKPESATRQGLAFVILGRPQSAQRALNQAHPKHEIASYYLGKSHLDLDELSQAREVIDASFKAHKGSPQIAQLRVHSLLRCAELDAGVEALEALKKSHGDSTDVAFLEGFRKEIEGDYDAAREAYEAVLEKEPTHPQALFRLARHHQTWGEEEDARGCYETLREQSPTYAHALLNLGNLYEDQQKYDLAIDCYEEVLKAIPNHSRALMFLGDARASKTMFYDEEGERRADRQSAILKIPVTDFELSVRSRNCLNKMNIRTLGDLIQMTEAELLAHKNFGETSLMEVKQMLAQKGLRLGQGKIEGGSLPVPTKSNEVSEEVLTEHIDTLDLSVRSRKCMERLGIGTVGALIGRTEAELLTAKNFGQTSLNEIKMRLEERGLRLKDAPY